MNQEYCDKWLANPLINPVSGRKISPNGNIYKTFEKYCSEKHKGSTNIIFDCAEQLTWKKMFQVNVNVVKKIDEKSTCTSPE